MPVLDAERVEVLEGVGAPEPTSEDLKLSESTSVLEAVQDDGSVLMHLIRPCVGRGRGKHLYRAEMLEANAGKFSGWKMYLNHLSDQARRALGGLPRDVRDSGGIVQESWWDPDVPAEGRFGRGAVVGKVKPVPLVQELLRVDPRLVEASINATATTCKPGTVGRERVWIVEGIEDKGSVDWVTEAGAGGRVATIMEALIEDGSAITGALDTLDDGTILAWVERHRPELFEAMKSKTDDKEKDAGDDDDDELEEQVQKLLKNPAVKSRAQAVAMAKKALARKKVSESEEGDEVADITPEVLTEALTSDEGQEAIAAAVTAAVRSLDLGSEVVALVEARLEQDREVIRAEAGARADRRNDLRDLRDLAHRKIDESRLHDRLKEAAKAKFDLVEGVPTSALNVIDDEDEQGAVVKSASEKIDEAVREEIREGLTLMADLNPTRVRGQGPEKRVVEGEQERKGDSDGDGGDKPDTVGEATRSLLEGAGIKADPEEVYAKSL